MKIKHRQLLFALVFPVVALAALTAYKAFKRFSGIELTIPITGYDPRDLLSGHYLTYRMDFKQEICQGKRRDTQVFLCVVQDGDDISSRVVSSPSRSMNEDCTAIIRGRCDRWRFVTGVERFYVPEEHSRTLDRIVRGWGSDTDRAKLVISVDDSGRAVVKDLLIDGKPWREFLATTAGN